MNRQERHEQAIKKVNGYKSQMVRFLGSGLIQAKADKLIKENPQEAELVRRALTELKSSARS